VSKTFIVNLKAKFTLGNLGLNEKATEAQIRKEIQNRVGYAEIKSIKET
jgi:hypothetical protein